MGIKVEVDYDSFDDALVDQLKGFVKGILDEPWVYDHNYKSTLDQVDAFIGTLFWYMTHKQHKEYKESIKREYDSLVKKAYGRQDNSGISMQITKVTELPDGGANVEYKCNMKTKEFLMSVGFRKILSDHLEAEIADVDEVPGFEYWQDMGGNTDE